MIVASLDIMAIGRRALSHFVATFVVIVFTGAMALAQDARISIYSPKSGSQVERGSELVIEYELEDPKASAGNGNTVIIEFSSNSGDSWDVISKSEEPTTKQVSWAIPKDAEVGTYLIRIRENDTRQPTHQEEVVKFEVIDGCRAPSLITSLSDVEVCEGTAAAFRVVTEGDVVAYQWFYNGRLIAETDRPSYSIPAVTMANRGQYRVVIVGRCGDPISTADVVLRVTEGVRIAAQPAPVTRVCENGAIELRVQATGAGLGYQWRKDGAPIPGETGQTLRMDPTRISDIGRYDVIVTGTCSTGEFSNVAEVFVERIPRITLNPESAFVCEGSTVVLSADAIGEQLTFQWLRNDEPVEGATERTLVLENVSASTIGLYECRIVSLAPNPLGCIRQLTTAPARVSTFAAPTFVTVPTSTEACLGGSVRLVSSAVGNGLAYQWFRNGVRIANAIGSELSLNNLTSADAAEYSVRVTGTCGTEIASPVARLELVTLPVFTVQPERASVLQGATVSIVSSATQASGYQWLRNGTPLRGATSATYTITNVTTDHAGLYTVIATNSCGSVVSRSARIRVTDPSSLRPEVAFSVDEYNAGEIPVRQSRNATLSGLIKNVGQAELIVQDVDVIGNNFEVTQAPATPFRLAPGESASVAIRATATAVGPFQATLIVSSNGIIPSEQLVLSAMGVQRFSAATVLNFGVVPERDEREVCIDIQNTSAVAIDIDNATVSGAAVSDFAVVTPMPLALAPGATSKICVRFAPQQAGTKNATMELSSANGGFATVALEGQATPTVSVDDNATSVLAVYPNPTRGAVTIRSTSSLESVRIVDVTGATVAVINGGAEQIEWNGTFSDGSPVPPGLYTFVITSNNSMQYRHVSIVR